MSAGADGDIGQRGQRVVGGIRQIQSVQGNCIIIGIVELDVILVYCGTADLRGEAGNRELIDTERFQRSFKPGEAVFPESPGRE